MLTGRTSPDASIAPQAPGSSTNEPSIVIGENCAAMILEDAMAVLDLI
jgi:choline dehydrogenase